MFVILLAAFAGAPLLAHPFDDRANMQVDIVLQRDAKTGDESIRLDMRFAYDSVFASYNEAADLDKNNDGRITREERDIRFRELADEMVPVTQLRVRGELANIVPRFERWTLRNQADPEQSVHSPEGLERFGLHIQYFFSFDVEPATPWGRGTHNVELVFATQDISILNAYDTVALIDDRGESRRMDYSISHDRISRRDGPETGRFHRSRFQWTIGTQMALPEGVEVTEDDAPADDEEYGRKRLEEMDAEYDDQSSDALIRRAFNTLRGNETDLGIWAAVLLAMFLLGAWHALQPGHGKALVASYLIGTQGTKSDALFLGVVVTAAHTSGIYLLMGGAWAASEFWPGVLQNPEQQLAEYITIAVGATIMLLGFSLVLKRAGGKPHVHDIFGRHVDPADDHHHHDHHGHEHHHHHHDDDERSPEDSDFLLEVVDGHDHHHDHDHGHHHDHHHGHGHHHHHHEELDPSKLTRWEILRLGMLGGIIPCPAGFVIGLIAFQQQWYVGGLLMVTAFSIGLATVLATIGLILVQTKSYLAARRRETKSPRLAALEAKLPVFGAMMITLVGMVILLFALIRIDVIDPTTWGM
jgi:nickel/cobalt transporter (NicO) family protein